MAKAMPEDDLHVSYLEALDDEYWALLGEPTPRSSPLRQAYREGRRKFAAAARSGGDDQQRAETELARIESDFRHDLLDRFHQRQRDGRAPHQWSGRSALCFSGGGIRSATFGLGILQGLAAHSSSDGDRPLLLGEFDYLSTVSGGGYLGAWFSAWASREAASDPGPAGGVSAVIRKLAMNPDTGFDPEPAAVRHLRGYSNYLVPRLGLLSGDTWAVIGTVVRNMFLNWLVLVPLFAVVVLVPEAAVRIVQTHPRSGHCGRW